MRIVEVIADAKHAKTLAGIARFYGAEDYWWTGQGPAEDGRRTIRMLVPDDSRQALIDALQDLFKADAHAWILVQPVDTVLTRDGPIEKDDKEGKAKTVAATREEL